MNYVNIDRISIVIAMLLSVAILSAQNKVGLIAPDILTHETEGTICIPFTTENFIDVKAFAFGLKYDPEVVSYSFYSEASLTNFRIRKISSMEGYLSIIWIGDGALHNLDNGAILIELFYEIVGSAGSVSIIEFVEPGFPIEFIGRHNRVLEHFIKNGSFNIIQLVPTLSTWGLFILILILLIFGVITLCNWNITYRHEHRPNTFI